MMLSVAKKWNPLNLIRALFPEYCVHCQTMTFDCICTQCMEKMPSHWTKINGITTLSGYHDTPLKTILHEIKFNQNQRICHWLGEYLKTTVTQLPYQGAIWVPVPQHPNRIQMRGFNPLALLFDPLLNAQQIMPNPIMQRVINTPALHGYSREKRFQLMAHAIGLSPCFNLKTIFNRDIVIYDDIYTTGATMAAMTNLISCYNVASIHYLTLTVTE